jgi:hypothetical protein
MASGNAQDASFCTVAGAPPTSGIGVADADGRKVLRWVLLVRCIDASAVEAEHRMGRNERRVGRERDDKTLRAEFSA